MDFAIDLLLTLHIAVSLLLVLVVLMQRPRSEGLGTAFASGMVEQYIGPATGVLVKFTTYMGGAFFLLTIILAILYAHRTTERSKIGERLRSVPAVKAVVKPTPPPPALAIKAPSLPVPAASPGLLSDDKQRNYLLKAPTAPVPAASVSPAPSAPAAVASPAPTAVATPNDIPAAAALAAPSASAAPPAAAPTASPAAH